MNKTKFVSTVLLLVFCAAIPAAADLSGEWHRTKIEKASKATITITNASEKSFEFSFEGFYAANSGEMEGTAVFTTKNKAVCNFKDEDLEGEIKIAFEQNGDELSVSVEEGNTFGLFGMGVFIDGTYIKGEPVYTNANIVAEVLGDNVEKMKKLIGKNSFNGLVSVMEEGISSEAEGLTYSGFINGAGMGVDFIIDGGKIYCLSLNLDENYDGYIFYTDDVKYANELPAVMKEHINDELNLKFVYKDPNFKMDDNLFGKFNTILSTVYVSEIEDLSVSPFKYNLLGEEVAVYTVTCKNGLECNLAVMSDGGAYINENEDTPNWKRIVIGNIIYIGSPVNDYYADVNYDAFAQEVADKLLEKPGKAAPVNPDSDIAQLIIDHRKVRIYGINYEFDVGPFIALDDTTEYVYCSPNGNPEEFFRREYDFEEDAYSIGIQVSVDSAGVKKQE